MKKNSILRKLMTGAVLACMLTTQSVFASTITTVSTTSGNSIDDIDYLNEYDNYYKYDYNMQDDYINEDLNDIVLESSDKKVLIIGDSLSVGYVSAYHPEWGRFAPFTSYLDEMPGIQVVRKAYGGATLSTATQWENPFSLTRETDFSYFDIIILFMGTNDWDCSTPLGGLDSHETSEFCGSFNTIMDQLLLSGAKVYGVTPLPRIEKFDGRTNWQGLTTTDYANTFRDLCLYRNVPIIDCQTEFNIDGTNYMNNYIDFVHPKPGLAKGLAEYIYSYIKGGNANADMINGFTSRLYQNCLSRTPDPDGANYWYNQLASQKNTGAEVAEGFFFSKEFLEHNYSDEEYLTLLYRTMMDREPDSSGMSYWKEVLNTGVSRKYVFRGFCESKEFTEICEKYGIVRGGVLLTEARDYSEKGTALISRMYTKALGRGYDVDGLNYWTEQLWSGRAQIDDVSTNGFFHSKEFIEHNYSDEEYTKILYRTYLNREYDETGLNYWCQLLKGSYNRDQVMYGFSNSEEFEKTKDVYVLRNGY